MTEFLRVKNWDKHQHYKNKEHPPPWIKLKRAILTDYEVRALTESDRWKLVALWLLASEKDGTIPNDAKYVANCIGVKRINLNLFVSRGFLEKVYSESRQNLDAVEEKREQKQNPGLNESSDDASGDRQGQGESQVGQTPGEVIAAHFGRKTA